MKLSNRWVPIVIASVIGFSLIKYGAFAMSRAASDIPLPLNSPPGAEYKMPINLPGKTGGPFLATNEIKELVADVAKAHGELSPKIKAIVLTKHGSLIDEGVFSPSYSVANDREIYLITMEGNFTFTRVRLGQNPIKAAHVNVEIDATTGDVLAVGTSPITKDQAVLQKLELKSIK